MVIEHKANEERYACVAEHGIDYAYKIAEAEQTEREGHEQQRGSEKLSVFVYAGKMQLGLADNSAYGRKARTEHAKAHQ